MKITKKRAFSILLVAVIISSGLCGCIKEKEGGVIVIPSAAASSNQNPKYSMASHYELEGFSINSKVPEYKLPLDLNDIYNKNIYSKLFLTDEQKELLKNNGFVVIDYGNENSTVKPYKELKERGIPIFVTSDTLLHLYHIQFNEILKGIEEREFFDQILDISKAMFDRAKEDYRSFTDSDLKEAARRNVAYFAVGLSLLQTPTENYDDSEDIREIDFKIPSYIQDELSGEIGLIEAHSGFSKSLIFGYKEDYSQYVPRGHYTRSEKLKRYFKAMMWYGRMAFLMKGGEPHCQLCEFLISEEDAKIATIQASLISTALPSLTANEETLEDLWSRIYSVTSFFVGKADDLTPYEYLGCIKKVFGLEFNTTELVNDTKLLDLKIELIQLRNPEIYGGTGNIVVTPPVTEDTLKKVLEKTKGMRFMGQRFIPDSYMFQHLTTTTGDHIGDDDPFTMCITGAGRKARCFPRGLDVMAVLGSERAYEILMIEGDTEYEGINTSYDKQLVFLKEKFSDSNINVTEWNHNLYWSWLYALKSLIKEFNKSYPTFMQQTAWLDKELQTALASWTELRHDTILYAKQSYTMMETSIPPPVEETIGYVEPVPEFYARLLALTKMTNNGLTEMDVLNQTEKNRLQNLQSILNRLIDISKSELENEKLSDDDYTFIRNFGENIENIVTGVEKRGQQTTIVADVHTDANTNQCLEEGVGYVDLILVAYKLPDGKIRIGAGPVFSYYEFKQDLSEGERLTDEEWVDMLKTDPQRPSWISSFIAE